MNFDRLEPYFTALIAPAVAAIATALIVWLRETMRRRDEAFRLRQVVATATKEVQFIQAWIAASRELDTENTRDWVHEQVRVDLDHAYASVAEARVKSATRGRKRTSPREAISAIFLRGRLVSPWARAGLIVHYSLLATLLGYLIFYPIYMFGPDYDAGETPFYAYLLVLSVQSVYVWLWRSLLLWVDRRSRRVKAATSPRDSDISQTSERPEIEVFHRGMWRGGVLDEWQHSGQSWVGRVRFDDGTVSGWIPAERLRQASEPMTSKASEKRYADPSLDA